MNIEDLSKLLLNDNLAEAKAQVLQNTLIRFMMLIANSIPDVDKNHIGFLIQILNQNGFSVGRDIATYFSGAGPKARLIFEQVQTNSWIADITKTKDFSGLLKPELEKFKIPFSTKSEEIAELKEWTDRIRNEVLQIKNVENKAIHKREFDHSELSLLTTGVYQMPGYQDEIVILRNKLEHNVEVLYFSWTDKDYQLWYYHPLEDAWICGNLTAVFPHTVEALSFSVQEIVVEAEAAEKTAVSVDFETTLDNLAELAYVIFEYADYLPDTATFFENVIYINRSANLPFQARFQKGPEQSSIEIILDNMSLLFVDTRGSYPSRNYSLLINMKTFSSKVDYSTLDTKTKKSIIKKTDFILGMFWGCIEQSEKVKEVESKGKENEIQTTSQ